MSQKSTLRAIDSFIADAFISAGLADEGLYTAPGGQPVACRVMLDDAAQIFGDDGAPITGNRTTIAFLREDVDEPARGATVTIGADLYTLTERVLVDQSMSTWVVTR